MDILALDPYGFLAILARDITFGFKMPLLGQHERQAVSIVIHFVHTDIVPVLKTGRDAFFDPGNRFGAFPCGISEIRHQVNGTGNHGIAFNAELKQIAAVKQAVFSLNRSLYVFCHIVFPFTLR